MITGKNTIGFTLSAKGTTTFKTYNPKARTENPWLFTEATTEELSQAMKLAHQAFPKFKAISAKDRAHFLQVIAEEMEAVASEIITVYQQESGLPEGRAKGELGRTLGQLKGFASALEEGTWVEATIDTGDVNRQPAPKEDIRKMLVPIGPIAVFGASNFPLAYSTAGGDTASALAVGCPVIVKSHPMHAGTGELVAAAIVKAAKKTNMPEGVFANLNSNSLGLGAALVAHPLLKGVGFTGSIKGGTALYALAAKREEPIPVFAEMGSVNPVVVLPSALQSSKKNWAKAYANSISLGVGQFCTSPGLIFGISSPEFDSFTSDLANELSNQERSCMLHPAIYKNFAANRENIITQATIKKIQVVAEEELNPQPEVVLVSGKDFLANSALHHEVFGPFAVAVKCENKEELVTIIDQLEGQLTGTILADEIELTQENEILSALQNRVGRLIFNGVPTGVEVCNSMQHGGPFPASTDSRFTAVGMHAMKRWARPVAFQNWPNTALPLALQNENPLGILRLLNNEYTTNVIM